MIILPVRGRGCSRTVELAGLRRLVHELHILLAHAQQAMSKYGHTDLEERSHFVDLHPSLAD